MVSLIRFGGKSSLIAQAGSNLRPSCLSFPMMGFWHKLPSCGCPLNTLGKKNFN